jgi:hypothetical protein
MVRILLFQQLGKGQDLDGTLFFVKVDLERAISHSPMKIQCVHILIW